MLQNCLLKLSRIPLSVQAERTVMPPGEEGDKDLCVITWYVVVLVNTHRRAYTRTYDMMAAIKNYL